MSRSIRVGLVLAACLQLVGLLLVGAAAILTGGWIGGLAWLGVVLWLTGDALTPGPMEVRFRAEP